MTGERRLRQGSSAVCGCCAASIAEASPDGDRMDSTVILPPGVPEFAISKVHTGNFVQGGSGRYRQSRPGTHAEWIVPNRRAE